jgi:beta-lactamase regulating signal transducer with metallopeptidase domain/predicted  nucleic acid-binding Zn-ribbon protein
MSAGELLVSLLEAAVKAGVLLVLAAGLVTALRRAPARSRHAVWAGALAGALLLPALSPWMPVWSIAALPMPALPAPAPAGGLPATDGPVADGAEARAGTSGSSSNGLEQRRRASGSDQLTSRAAAQTVAGSAPPAWAPVAAPAAWLLGVWLLGCAAALGSFVRSMRAARRLERGAEPVGASWRRSLEQARRRMGLSRPVRLLESSRIARPMTWGWRRPVILLPESARGWTDERRRVVLLHELAHVRRADWLVRLVARLACTLYWFNPLAWAAARRLTFEQEIACDEEVVALGTRPSSYARHLLAIARSLAPAAAAPAHALDMARRSQMEGRVMSILDGRKRPGGRGLAILALAVVAGLVPALAAIEPWVEEQESPMASPGWPTGGASPSAGTPSAGTEGVARVLGELEELERRMEPFEAELEGLESEMEPIERELEGIEVEMGPVEVELEGLAAELEPFAEMLEAVEVEMGPVEVRLEAIAAELEPFEEQLEGVELEIQPFQERLEAIEVELQPFEERLEEIEVELAPQERELERLSEQMEPLAREGVPDTAELERLAVLMQEVHQRMEPLHERMAAAHEQMQPVYERLTAVHQEMEPLHERMQAIHQQMAPVFERMAAVHEEMEPLHERMAVVHQQMEPVHQRMGAVHESMEPYHQRMSERHESMEPYFEKMGEIHERMRPLHEEMGRRHLELERELTGLVERMLATELGGVTAAGTDYAPAAAGIVDAVSLRVEDGTLRIRSSDAELRQILDVALGDRITGSEPGYSAAADRFLRTLGDLQIESR